MSKPLASTIEDRKKSRRVPKRSAPRRTTLASKPRPLLAAGSSSPVADVGPMPPEVLAWITPGSDWCDDPVDPVGLAQAMREEIAGWQAMPAPALPPLTGGDIVTLCRRFPGIAPGLYGSRRFAEAARAVLTLADENWLLCNDFVDWMQNANFDEDARSKRVAK